MLRYEERKYSRENGMKEAEFEIRRKKELEMVKEKDVMSEQEKEKLRVAIDEGMVSQVQKERNEDMGCSKVNGRVVSYAQLVEREK